MVQLDGSPALLVFDMQNGFCHERGTFTKMGMVCDPTAIIRTSTSCAPPSALPTCRSSSCGPDTTPTTLTDAVTIYKTAPDRLETLQGFLRGSWDADILDELTPDPNEIIMDKTRNSALLRTSLEETLKEHGVNHVILMGVGTDVCVESTARDAYQRDFDVTTVSDATGTCNESDHLAALHSLRHFGGTASTAEVIEALQKK